MNRSVPGTVRGRLSSHAGDTRPTGRERPFHIDGGFDNLLFRIDDPSFPLGLLLPYAGLSEDDSRQFAAALPKRWQQTDLH